MAALGVFCAALFALADGAAESRRDAEQKAPVELVDVLEGVPRHRIPVATFSEDQAAITLDGHIDEPIWRDVPYYDEFIVAVPDKGTPGEYATELRMFATKRGLYVGAILYQPPQTLVSRLSVRDDFLDRDTFGMNIDASGEGLVGYWFILALSGSVQDGKILPERNYSRDWDGPWIGRSAVREDGWSAEMFLPWSMMNMPEVAAQRTVGFTATRQVSHKNERYQWPGHPYSSARFLSAFNEMRIRDVAPVSQFAAIPYVSGTLDEANDENEVQAGLDLAYKPSPRLEITATLNPDFGAVEADDVVLNLTAAETFFPEKRLFFLEGNEVFDAHPRSGIGYIARILANDDFNSTSRKVTLRDFIPTPISLLNTRRIGGAARQVELADGVSPLRGQQELPTDLLGAAKLTGQVGDIRYGVMGAFEDDVDWRGADALGRIVPIDGDGRDFAISRFLYENVSLGGLRSLGYLGTHVSGALFDSTVHSIDGHLRNASGNFIADVQFIMSERDDVEGYGGLFDMMYAVHGGLRHKVEFEYMDQEVDFNDLGFLRRNNYASGRYILLYNKQNIFAGLTNYRTTLVLEQQYNTDEHQRIDGGLYWRNSVVLPGRNTLKASLAYLPDRWEDFDSRGNGAYRVEDRGYADLVIATNAAHRWSYMFSAGALQEHLGDWTLTAAAGFTWRPSEHFLVELDGRYKRRAGWLVYQGGRNFGAYDGLELQAELDFNWFISYNHQIGLSLQWVGVQASERGFFAIPLGDGRLQPAARTLADHDFTVSLLTAQLRYRWEIAPLTDLFVVYNRGNSLPNQNQSSFDDLLSDAFRDPVIDSFIVKLRWRFGN